jgi:hypothetical protein
MRGAASADTDQTWRCAWFAEVADRAGAWRKWPAGPTATPSVGATQIWELPLMESQAGVDNRKRHPIVRDPAAVIYLKGNIVVVDSVLFAD